MKDLGEMRGPVFDYIIPVHVEGLWLPVYGPINETVPFSSTFHSAILSLQYMRDWGQCIVLNVDN